MADGGTGALDGLRVLDLSRVLAGPWASQTLADLGADVVKVERPDGGDDTRAWGPPWLVDAHGAPTAESAYFQCANRNKRSITADLATPEGAGLVRALAAHADVLLENFKVGGLTAYGLDHAALSTLNRRLVYVSVTGFGQTGPRAPEPGYDALIQAMGGMMSITGAPDAEGGRPVRAGVAVADIFTGLYAAVGTLAALRERERSGLGQHVDLSLFDVQLAVLANQGQNALVTGRTPERLGSAHPSIVPYQDFQTADGAVMLAVGNDGQFARLCQALGTPELAEDPRYRRNAERVANRAELLPRLQARLRTRSSAAWAAELSGRGVPCGPVNTIAEALADPQAVARGAVVELPHASGVRTPSVENPIRLSRTPVRHRGAGPLLGQHDGAAVLAEWSAGA